MGNFPGERFDALLREYGLSESGIKVTDASPRKTALPAFRDFHSRMLQAVRSLPGTLEEPHLVALDTLLYFRRGRSGLVHLEILKLAALPRRGVLTAFREIPGLSRLYDEVYRRKWEDQSLWISASYRENRLREFTFTLGVQDFGPETFSKAVRMDLVWKEKDRWKGECFLRSGKRLSEVNP